MGPFRVSAVEPWFPGAVSVGAVSELGRFGWGRFGVGPFAFGPFRNRAVLTCILVVEIGP